MKMKSNIIPMIFVLKHICNKEILKLSQDNKNQICFLLVYKKTKSNRFENSDVLLYFVANDLPDSHFQKVSREQNKKQNKTDI